MNDKILEDLECFLFHAVGKKVNDSKSTYFLKGKHADFFFSHSIKEMRNYVLNYLKNNKINNKYDELYFFNSLLKYMGGKYDESSYIRDLNNVWFPIRFQIVEDTIYIDSLNDKKYIKAKLEGINGIDIKTIIDELESCISYGTETAKKFFIENHLYNQSILLSLPSITTDCSFIEYNTNKGNIRFARDKQVNLICNNRFDNYIVNDKILIFRYPLCNNIYRPLIDKITKIIEENNITDFVLDLRNNFGGDADVIQPLIDYLSKTNLRLTTIVNKGVMESGIFAVIDMKRLGSKIIGEDIGSLLDFFGNANYCGQLPNAGFEIKFPSVFWSYDRIDVELVGMHELQDLSLLKKILNKQKYLILDEYITISKKEYENSNDEDIILNKSINYIKNNNFKHTH